MDGTRHVHGRGWMDPISVGVEILRGETIMSKTLAKWSLLVAGSTVVALNLGACIADLLLQAFVFAAVN
jgi:hypothetical protein